MTNTRRAYNGNGRNRSGRMTAFEVACAALVSGFVVVSTARAEPAKPCPPQPAQSYTRPADTVQPAQNYARPAGTVQPAQNYARPADTVQPAQNYARPAGTPQVAANDPVGCK